MSTEILSEEELNGLFSKEALNQLETKFRSKYGSSSPEVRVFQLIEYLRSRDDRERGLSESLQKKVEEIHDLAGGRPGSCRTAHSMAGCAIDSILSLKEGLHEVAQERDALKALAIRMRDGLQEVLDTEFLVRKIQIAMLLAEVEKADLL